MTDTPNIPPLTQGRIRKGGVNDAPAAEFSSRPVAPTGSGGRPMTDTPTVDVDAVVERLTHKARDPRRTERAQSEYQAAAAALRAQADRIRALEDAVKDTRVMILAFEKALGDEGLIIDIPDPVPPLLAKIRAILGDRT